VERRYQKASAADGAGDVVVSGHVLGGSASVDFRF
jgi:hypothetical protein